MLEAEAGLGEGAWLQALARDDRVGELADDDPQCEAGRRHERGAVQGRPSARAMSFWRAGSGPTRLTGPVISSWSSEVRQCCRPRRRA